MSQQWLGRDTSVFMIFIEGECKLLNSKGFPVTTVLGKKRQCDVVAIFREEASLYWA